jgi:hypothetical protein
VPLAISLDAFEDLITREGLWSWRCVGQRRRGRAVFATDVPGVQRCKGIIDFLRIENTLATPILQDLVFAKLQRKIGEKKRVERGSHLFCTHEIWETYTTLWYDKLDDFTQVPADVVDIERAVLLHTLAHSTGV